MHHRFQLFFGRHAGASGLGRFGKGFIDGTGGRGFGMGRKLASADLQLLILRLLKDKPHHGYEIIKALDEKSKGFYVPSPGMVYPALTYLEEVGHATVELDANRKRYHLTAAGRGHLAANQTRADALVAQFERVAERMDRVRHAMDAGEGAHSPTSADLLRARHALEAAIAEEWSGDRHEQQRILAILNRATAVIRGKSRSS